MPEIKHQFTGGKMNKDLDERLIPNGQYSDAMNIQVSTSEGSEVGTVQNILGNKSLHDKELLQTIGRGAVCVGSIADEKNDALYYLVWSYNADFILEYSGKNQNPIAVFVDKKENALKFDPTKPVTGINIIDGMLFWTDNNSEPKKINIERCKQGTDGFNQTKLINSSQDLSDPSTAPQIEEKHITVIRKAPKKPLDMRVVSSRDDSKTYTGVIDIVTTAEFESQPTNPSSFEDPDRYNFSGLSTEDGSNTFSITITEGITSGNIGPIGPINDDDGLTGWHKPNPTYSSNVLNNIAIGTKIVFQPFDDDGTPPGLPITDYTIKGVIEDAVPLAQDPNEDENTGSTTIKVKIIALDGFAPIPSEGSNYLRYAVDLWDEEERLFEFKFPRFSYRYKFEDGEYSAFAPFTQVAFLPGSFDYHPRKGYNLGMTNRAGSIELSRVVTASTPKDVVAIDILFKDETSPSIYVVDTIKPDQEGINSGLNTWYSCLGDWRQGQYSKPYVITGEQVQSILPSNQLLRPFDNVPRKALAQDITGNRIVYANYLQNYDLKTISGKKYAPEFTVTWQQTPAQAPGIIIQEDGLESAELIFTNSSSSVQSIKSIREYQLGVVFTDDYGRETPVISNSTGTKKLSKEDADKATKIRVMLNGLANKPEGLTHFKFYVKETSGQYYNMAMDRFYDAADGNVWMSFPSSDRDKIDIDTFLILKKGSDQDTLVVSPARYKIIAIENEAPDFIKTTRLIAASQTHNSNFNNSVLFSAEPLPFQGNDNFMMSYNPWGSGPGRNLDLKEVNETLYVEFTNGNQISDRYKITSIEHDREGIGISDPNYYVQLDRPLNADVNFVSNDVTGATSTSINDGTIVNIYRYKTENKPQFDGRFFIKIYEDETFTSNIGESFIPGLEFRTLASKKVYLMKNHQDHIDLHWTDTSKMLTKNVFAGGSPYRKLEDLTTNGMSPIVEMPTSGTFVATSGGGGFDEVWDWFNAGASSGSGYGDTIHRMNSGYYQIDEFASMATYFRKMRRSSSKMDYDSWFASTLWLGAVLWGTEDFVEETRGDIRQLTSGNASGNDVEYPEGVYWKDHPKWYKEFGQGTTTGHTARWRVSKKDTQYGIFTAQKAYCQESNLYSSGFEADNPIETDVWFIDEGPVKATRNGSTSDDMNFRYLSPDSIESQRDSTIGIKDSQVHVTGYVDRRDNTQGHQNQQGITSYSGAGYWRMDLAYGGIFSSGPEASDQEDHFNFGDWNTASGDAQNNYYANNNKNTSFAQSIQGNSQFRWKEDPALTVYTLGPNISTKKSLRHSSRNNSGRTVAVAPEIPEYQDAGNYYGGLWSGGGTSMAEGLSFNFTSGWRCKNITPLLAWDPLTDGKIASGYVIRLTATDVNGSNSSTATTNGSALTEDLVLYTDSILGTFNGDPATIHVGMALHRYTAAATGSSERSVSNNLPGTGVNDFLVVREIIAPNTANHAHNSFKLKLGGYKKPLTQNVHTDFTNSNKQPLIESEMEFVQVGMNGYSHNSEFNINTIGVQDAGLGCVGAVGYELEFIKYIEPEAVLSENPAIWETEPKEIKDLDVYYEASPAIPLVINASNIQDVIPIGTPCTQIFGGSFLAIDYDGADVVLAEASLLPNTSTGAFSSLTNSSMICFRVDGLTFNVNVEAITEFQEPSTGNYYARVQLKQNLYENTAFTLPWYNCYSFGNGVESNRVRDNFNLPFIANGVRVSTTLEQEYKEERRSYGLIYSGIYNSTGGLNNLNQFIAAEKITKDVNPIYGSIQKLHSRDSDLVTLCEDKCLRILANKDAVFNADGNTNLTATENVLGQTIPFSGEYGISTNPESFATEAYRSYFTDRVRGAAMRLSKDGLTAISEAGMKDWFKDNLKLNNTAFGSYDDKKNEYNVTLSNNIIVTVNVLAASKFVGIPPLLGTANIETVTYIANLIAIGDSLALQGAQGAEVISKQNLGGGRWRITLDQTVDENAFGNVSYLSINNQGVPEGPYWKAFLQLEDRLGQTVSYREDVKGWVSFKSFTPENAISMANEYYSIMDGELWLHHNEEVDRNTFYDVYTNSSVEVVLNDEPSSIKSFNTLNYEGSQSKVDKFVIEQKSLDFQPPTTYNNQAIYNLSAKKGWYVETVYTDKEEGYIKEFIEKEGKWFNSINRRIDVELESADTGDFTFQGIGTPTIGA